MEVGPRAPQLSPGGRARRILPFIAVTALTFPLVLIGHRPGDGLGLVAVAAAIAAAVAVLIVVVPWWRLPYEARLILVVGFCVAVALLRHSGGGATGGYGGLLLLPIIYQAVYARWRDVVAATACSAATLAAPILLFGGPDYPVSEWRRVILSTLTFTLAGLVVNRLMGEVTRHQGMFARVLELTRELDGPDVQAAVCRAVQSATGADLVTYCELDRAGRGRVTSSTTTAIPTHPQAAADLPGDVQDVIASGEPAFIADLPGHPRVDQAVRAATGLASVLHQPVRRGQLVEGVISVGWRKPVARLDLQVAQVVELLAIEAAVAGERSRLVAQLDRLAHHDQLTGVYNRLAWDEALAKELARIERTGEPAALALLDLDRFKAYNDEHGHLAGDDLLRRATSRWTAELRAVDVLARWGGEEFVLLLPSTDLAAAGAVLDRLRDAMPDGQSFSAGLVAVSGRSAVDLLRAADAALYRAKAAGRARTEVGAPATPGHR